VEWQGLHAPGILTIQGAPGIDHVKLAKDLADKWNIIVKVFTEYPEREAPAIRLSWSATAPKQEVQEALGTISDCFGRS